MAANVDDQREPVPGESERTKTGFRLASVFRESDIQPVTEKMTRCQKVLVALDIFKFIPVPQTLPVSTKRSKCGSILLIVIFLAYVVYDFVELFLNNPPKVNSY